MKYKFEDIFSSWKSRNSMCLYSTTSVSKMMRSAELQGNIRLRAFLKKHGVIYGDYIAEEYVERGYFVNSYTSIQKGRSRVPVIKVTNEGVEFILQLEKRYYGNDNS